VSLELGLIRVVVREKKEKIMIMSWCLIYISKDRAGEADKYNTTILGLRSGLELGLWLGLD
jgi:hypothetical protein